MPLCKMIRAKTPELLAAWERRVRALPVTPPLPAPAHLERIRDLLSCLAARLDGGRGDGAALAETAAQYALDRLGEGAELRRVVSELRLLRAGISQQYREEGLPDAGALLAELARLDDALDDALDAAASGYTAARERSEEVREQLVGILAHDLRNPLAAISTSVSALLRAEDLGEKPRAWADRIAASADRMRRMIDDVLDFSRSQLGGGIPITPAEADMGSICTQIAAELEAAHSGGEILIERRGDLRGCWDGDRVAQALGNLLGNALTHGAVPVHFAVRDDGDAVVTEVRNPGPPIPDEVMPALFEPFQRGTERRTGLGLGLFIVREIARAHRGDIAVRSSADGVVFTVRWPRRLPA
jgi:signal transduction histidine kinase